jgi:Predicted membrane protein (DUF2243)
MPVKEADAVRVCGVLDQELHHRDQVPDFRGVIERSVDRDDGVVGRGAREIDRDLHVRRLPRVERFGIFNLVEGIFDHHLLGIHHVNETVPGEQWIYWDLGFLGWGAAMLIGGWLLLRAGRREPRNRAARHLARP